MFGSEKRGLSNEDLSHCHWLLRIPTREEHRSMNLGQAVAVCLYELVRNPKAVSKPEKNVAASAADLERLTSLLLEALRSSGYLKTNPAASKSAAPPLPPTRKFAASSAACISPPSDAELTLGILRQIFWKLRTGADPSA